MKNIYLRMVSVILLFWSFYCANKIQQLDKEDNSASIIIPNFHELKWKVSYSYPFEDCDFKLIKLDNDNAIIETRCMNEDDFEPYFALESVKIRAKNRDTFDILSENDLLNFQNFYYDNINNTITYDSKKSSVTTIDIKSTLLSEMTYLEDALGTWEDSEENNSNIVLSFTKNLDANITASFHSENDLFEQKVSYYSTGSRIILFGDSPVMYLEMGYDEHDAVNEIILSRVVEGIFQSYSLNRVEG